MLNLKNQDFFQKNKLNQKLHQFLLQRQLRVFQTSTLIFQLQML
jgi:hypothetical protein